MSQGLRAANKLRTGKLHATRLFRSDKWMKYDQSALVADLVGKPGGNSTKGRPESRYRSRDLSDTSLRRGVSRSDQDHWITPNWMKSHGLYMGYTIPHPSFCAVNENVDGK